MSGKMKTHRGAAKRFRKTARGRIRRNHAFGSHILTKKSPRRRRKLRSAGWVAAGDEKRIARLLR